MIASVSYYYDRYEEELARTDTTLLQLAETVENTAAIAAYLENEELARDVTIGLAKNDIVEGAAVTTQTGLLVKAGSIDMSGRASHASFALPSPFAPGESVGTIYIQPRQPIIQARARQEALANARLLAINSLFIALLVMLLVGRFLTRPLIRIAEELHGINPGSQQTLEVPRWHANDEIGGLVADTNQLLGSVHETLEKERSLRTKIEALEQRFRLIFEHASAGIFLMDPQGTLLVSNKAFDQLVGPELAGRMLETGQPKVTDIFGNTKDLNAALDRVVRDYGSAAIDLELSEAYREHARLLHCLFSGVIDNDGTLIIEGLVNDITERASRERDMQFKAAHDPLTGLLNRRAGKLRLRRAMEQADGTSDTSFAVLLMDLDRFKPINDKYGHEAGDQVLVEVTRRLRDSVRGEDLVIRWGGDEFVIGLRRGHGPLDPVPVVEKLIKEIGREIVLNNNQRVMIGASIGLALYPNHGDDLDQLVSKADDAMYEAKASGKNGYRVHDPVTNRLLAVSGSWPGQGN